MNRRRRNCLIPVSSHSRKRPQNVVMAKKSVGEVDGRINHPLQVQSKEVSATVASCSGDVDPNRMSHQLVSAWNASLTHGKSAELLSKNETVGHSTACGWAYSMVNEGRGASAVHRTMKTQDCQPTALNKLF
jgi:hypothetical protein